MNLRFPMLYLVLVDFNRKGTHLSAFFLCSNQFDFITLENLRLV
jgi:hypothetical protein